MMQELVAIKGVDIYLLDQLLKENIHAKQRVLDAGCGNGRNLFLLMQQGFDFVGIDADEDSINSLKSEFPEHAHRYINTRIEDFEDSDRFGAIICNAVLHFAMDHEQFDQMMNKLVTLLLPGGILFIRMTSNIGLESKLSNGTAGVFELPDGSRRYLITREKIDQMLACHSLTLVERVKTVNVDGFRCMTTLVLRK